MMAARRHASTIVRSSHQRDRAPDPGRRPARGRLVAVRRSQILLASADCRRPPAIADLVGGRAHTVRNAIYACNQTGLAALRRGGARPHTTHPAFDAPASERLRDLLHRRPRDFDRATSVGTLDGLAAVRFGEGRTARRVSGETVRATLARLGVRGRRATAWSHRPDPAYAHKNSGATG